MYIWEVRLRSLIGNEVSVGFARCETSEEAKRLVIDEIRSKSKATGWEVTECIKCE